MLGGRAVLCTDAVTVTGRKWSGVTEFGWWMA